MLALQTALNAVLPTFFLIFLGAFADKLFPKLDIETLSKLSVYILIPALIFDALAKTDLSLGSAAWLSCGYLLYLLVLGLISLPLTSRFSGQKQRGILVTTLFGNTGNMGLPITLFAYGQAGLERAVILLVVSLILMFVVGPALLTGSNDRLLTRIKAALKLPPIWATLAGLGLSVYQVDLPISLERTSSLLGSAAIPIMLLSLGMQMRRSWVWDIGGAAISTAALRLGLGPFVAYGVARLLQLDALDQSVLVLSAAMPAAVTMFVVAVEVKGDKEGVARSVVATTVGSLLAIMLVLFFFPG